MKLFSRLAALAVGAMCLFAGGIASADVPNLAFPPFDVNQTVYVARDMTDINVGNLGSRLDAAAASLRSGNGRTAHVYEVITKEPVAGFSGPLGPEAAETIANTWATKAAGRFPSNDFVLLVLVRHNDKPNHWAVGVRVGSAFQPYVTKEITTKVLSQNIQLLKDGNYVDYSVGSANLLVKQIGLTASASSAVVNRAPPVVETHVPYNSGVVVREPTRTSGGGMSWGLIIGLLIVIVLVVAAVMRLLAGSKLRAELDAALEKTSKQLKNVNDCKTYVQSNFDGLEKGDKKYKVGSVSQTQYTAAVTAWGQFFAHLIAVKARQEQIDAKVKAAIPVLYIEPLKEALELATSTPIEITGKELPASEITLDSGLIKKEQFTFPQLANLMGDEYKTVIGTLSTLRDSVRTSLANKRTIEADLAGVQQAKDSLDQAGVSFAPFQAKYDALSATITPLLTRVGEDPIGAKADSETTAASVTALKNSITQALELKKQIDETEATVNAARQAVATKRKEAICLTFVKKPLPPIDADVEPETFWLNEAGANPDAALAQASSQLQAFEQALSEGRVDDAVKAKAAALESAAEAQSTLKAVEAAKSKVEKDAPALQTQFGSDPGFAAIGNAYLHQNFVAAALLVGAFEQIGGLAAQRTEVGDALTEAKLCVTATTESLFAQAGKTVDDVTAETRSGSASPSVVSAHTEAASAALDKVSAAIRADVGVYNDGKTAVAGLRAARERAEAKINDHRVSDAPRQRIATVDAELTALEALYKSDSKQAWNTVSGRVKAATTTLGAIVDAAQAEIDKADEYEEKLQDLEQSYARYSGMTYSRTIRGRVYAPSISYSSTPYGILVAQHQAAANAYWESRNYVAMELELEAMREQMALANTFMWYETYNAMVLSGDPWARQYAYDQGFQDGQAFDSFNDHIESTHGTGADDWAYVPSAESEWQPSQVPAGATCGGADTDDRSGNGNGNGYNGNATGGVDTDDDDNRGNGGGGGGNQCGGVDTDDTPTSNDDPSPSCGGTDTDS